MNYNKYILKSQYLFKITIYLKYNQEQDFLLHPSFREYLWEWNESIILSEIIE